MLKKIIRKIYFLLKKLIASKKGSASYCTAHMVVEEEFLSVESSLEHFSWRNDLYPGYIELMPVAGFDDKVVVDYGCGPGNDLVGFSHFSSPKELIGIDVSKTALERAKVRLSLHGKEANLILVEEKRNDIPLEDKSIDLIHSSGVLHHCENLPAILKEFHRILKDDGAVHVMVYNYDSLWLHLYTAYVQQIERGKFKNMELLDAFRANTDGEFCPISHCYTPSQFVQIMGDNGFRGEFKGASMSTTELKLMHKRFEAIESRQLNKEHRDFLKSLTFDERQMPLINGHFAGINACYRFTKE